MHENHDQDMPLAGWSPDRRHRGAWWKHDRGVLLKVRPHACDDGVTRFIGEVTKDAEVDSPLALYTVATPLREMMTLLESKVAPSTPSALSLVAAVEDTRCTAFTAWFISSPYGGHWFVCGDHKDVVLAAQPGKEATPISEVMNAVTTPVGQMQNRWRCCWEERKHQTVRQRADQRTAPDPRDASSGMIRVTLVPFKTKSINEALIGWTRREDRDSGNVYYERDNGVFIARAWRLDGDNGWNWSVGRGTSDSERNHAATAIEALSDALETLDRYTRAGRDPKGWIITSTGRQFWPLDPRKEDVCIEDVAHHLAQCNRYCGAPPEPFSVAEHSVLVSQVVGRLTFNGTHNGKPIDGRRAALYACLHDGAEAFAHDVTRPMKRGLKEYHPIEARVQRAVMDRFGFTDADDVEFGAITKEADNIMLAAERSAFFKPETHPAALLFNKDEDHASSRMVIIQSPLPWRDAKALFLNRFKALGGKE